MLRVVKCRMWKTMNTSSNAPPHRIVREANVDISRCDPRL
jgi:hypothetical protein